MSDIHGCLDQFKKLLLAIEFSDDDQMFIMGDCIDRGPKSKQLLSFIDRSENMHLMLGNHEDMLLQVVKNPRKLDWWIGNGGQATLDSFGVTKVSDVPKKYINFLSRLPIVIEVDNFLLSHAGVDQHHPEPLRSSATNKVYMLWNRDVRAKRGAKRIVVGHTPKSLSEIKRSSTTNKIYVDGGCAYGGKLVAYCLDNDQIISVNGAR